MQSEGNNIIEEKFFIVHRTHKRTEVYILSEREMKREEEGEYLGSFDSNNEGPAEEFGPYPDYETARKDVRARIE